MKLKIMPYKEDDELDAFMRQQLDQVQPGNELLEKGLSQFDMAGLSKAAVGKWSFFKKLRWPFAVVAITTVAWVAWQQAGNKQSNTTNTIPATENNKNPTGVNGADSNAAYTTNDATISNPAGTPVTTNDVSTAVPPNNAAGVLQNDNNSRSNRYPGASPSNGNPAAVKQPVDLTADDKNRLANGQTLTGKDNKNNNGNDITTDPNKQSLNTSTTFSNARGDDKAAQQNDASVANDVTAAPKRLTNNPASLIAKKQDSLQQKLIKKAIPKKAPDSAYIIW